MQQLFELNIRTWCSERSGELGRPATLDDLDDRYLDDLVDSGFTWLYLIGVWTIGPRTRAVALADQHLRSYLASVLPDFCDADITGSPFSPASYSTCPTLGGDAALARLRDRARSSGLSLMLDFIPNHVGLDHAWLSEQPDYFIAGDEGTIAALPEAYCRLNGRICAHGRDPFFAPWRHTVQLDFAQDMVQNAVIEQAKSIASRCDGLRCDVAMLLLPDVFENTWKRPMPPFWRRCLDEVRAAHPGTLFMAEVYWNREYELQQAGFDFTFDKLLYDRLLAGDAESIRAHLRAALDFQRHCVRFLENHEEQRAAAHFSDPAHHRAALLLTGMVPGLLLCHDGQQDGRRLHASTQACRRPPEDGSVAHRAAFRDLMHLLSEPARQDGVWHLLEPRAGRDSSIIGCLWTLPVHHALLLVVNASPEPSRSAIHPGPLAQRDCQFQTVFEKAASYVVKAEVLAAQGISVDLPAWGSVVYRILPLR